MSRVLTDEILGSLFFSASDGSDVGAGTSYPIGLSFEEFAEWFHQVRKIEATWSMSTVDVNAEYSNPPFTETTIATWGEIDVDDLKYDSQCEASIGVPISEEYELINGISKTGSGSSSVLKTEGFTQTDITTNSSLIIGDEVKLYAGLLYPKITLGFTISAYARAGNPPLDSYEERTQVFTSGVGITVPPTPDVIADGEFDVSIGGENVTVIWYITESVVSYADPTTPFVSVTTSIIMDEPLMLTEFIEWWPYNPGDGGGPIWSTTNGSKLRPNYQ